MSPKQFTSANEVLRTVDAFCRARAPEQPTVHDVAAAMGSSPAAVAQHSLRLKSRGLLVFGREQSPYLRLTPAGVEVLQRLAGGSTLLPPPPEALPALPEPPPYVPPSDDDWTPERTTERAPLRLVSSAPPTDPSDPPDAAANPTTIPPLRSVDVYAVQGNHEARRAAFRASAKPVMEDLRRTSAARLRVMSEEYPEETAHLRPKTRGDCIDGIRPCPFVSCKHHLYLSVARNGNIKVNFPDVGPEDLPTDRSCTLDVADAGEHTLEEVGLLLGVVRERARQLEASAVAKVLRHKQFVEENR